MKALPVFAMIALFAGTAVTASAEGNQQVLVATASNTTTNQLLVYDTAGRLIQTLATGGQGGQRQCRRYRRAGEPAGRG
jgi:hypothetical protein